MELPSKIEIYSAIPYGGGDDGNIDEWFHVARNEPGEHIEAIWDIEAVFRPDVSEEDKPGKLLGLESVFDEIRLHYCLNYVHWRYHEELLIYCLRALKPGGKLQIISPDLDWILRYWLADILTVDMNKYVQSEEIDRLRAENEQLKAENERLREKLSIGQKPWWRRGKREPAVEAILKDAEIPANQLPRVERSEIEKEVPDKVLSGVQTDWDFDLWMLQQMYSSGAGEPQDTFKAVFNKRYLSTLLRRTQFVITLLQNNPENPKQIEAKAFKHPSRLFSDYVIKGGDTDEGGNQRGDKPDSEVST